MASAKISLDCKKNFVMLYCEFKININSLHQRAVQVYNRMTNELSKCFQNHNEIVRNLWNRVKERGGILYGLRFNSLDVIVIAKDQDSADNIQKDLQTKEFLDEVNKWFLESDDDSTIKVEKLISLRRDVITLEKSFEMLEKEAEEALEKETYKGTSKKVSPFL